MKKINGHIVAPFTPLNEDRTLNLPMIEKYYEYLKLVGLDGVFICGSSGEGALLTTEERMLVAEKWLSIAESDFKVIVHVGACHIEEQKKLAKHAQENGAFAIGSMPPAFMPPANSNALIEYCKEIASAASEIGFYYYHIPALTGVNLSVLQLLKDADKHIPNFAGVKYTYENILEFAQAKLYNNSKYDIAAGLDENYLSSQAFKAESYVGGTFNHIFPVYKKIEAEFAKGNLEKCIELQNESHKFINVLIKYRGNIVGGKRMMKFLGIDCGPNRLPLESISADDEVQMKKDLEEIGFFEMAINGE
jgi:N-acetylneuraminate lyase